MGIISTNADRLSGLIEKLDLKDATLIGFSAGGGKVARYIGRNRSARLVKNATLKVYKGESHGIAHTHTDQFNADLLAFLKT